MKYDTTKYKEGTRVVCARLRFKLPRCVTTIMRLQKPFPYIDFSDKNIPWYLHDTVGIEFGPTGATVNDDEYMHRMTGADIVKKSLEANAEYAIIFCKDSEYAYYHSKYRPLPPGLGGRDLLDEACEAANGTPLRILAYACVQYDTYARERNPDWELIDCKGNLLYRLCLRSPGYIEYMKGVIDELMAYDIAGVHVDMMDLGFSPPYGCWCKHCKSEFKKRYGYDMPEKFDLDDPRWDDMQEFRYSNSRDMALGLTEHVHKNYPGRSIDFNYHGSPPFYYAVAERPIQHAKYGDFITAESLPWIFGYNNISMISHFLEAANREIPYQVVSSRSIYNYHEYTLRPAEDIRFEVMDIIANGGMFTMVDKAGYDGWFDPNVYKRLSGVFAEVRRKAMYTRGYLKEADCAIYFSNRTRDYVYRENSRDYQNAIAGLCRMLVQEHISYTFIFDEDVTAEKLAQYPLVILTNTCIITPREASLFREYVENGGNIAATGTPGTCDANGRLTCKCVISDLLGVKFNGITNAADDSYIILPDDAGDEFKAYVNDIENGYQLYCRDKLYDFTPTSASVFGDIYTGFRPCAEEALVKANSDVWKQLMSAGIKKGGAVFTNKYGAGKAVLLPYLLERAYMGSHRTPEQRKLLCNILRTLMPAPQIKAELPLNTELIVTCDTIGGKTLTHMVTYNPTLPALDCSFNCDDRRHYAPVMEQPAMYRGRLKPSFGFSRAYSIDGTPLTVKDSIIEFVTEQVYEIIIIE